MIFHRLMPDECWIGELHTAGRYIKILQVISILLHKKPQSLWFKPFKKSWAPLRVTAEWSESEIPSLQLLNRKRYSIDTRGHPLPPVSPKTPSLSTCILFEGVTERKWEEQGFTLCFVIERIFTVLFWYQELKMTNFWRNRNLGDKQKKERKGNKDISRVQKLTEGKESTRTVPGCHFCTSQRQYINIL